MNTTVNKFRYTLTDRIGPLIVAPLGESDFILQWDRETSGKLDYKNTLPSAIVFTGDAFHKLLTIETSIYRCEFSDLTVERNCGADSWTPWFSGRLSNNDGQWDLDRCIATMKMDDINPGQCIEDGKTTPVNLFAGIDSGLRRSVLINPGNIVIEKVDYSRSSSGLVGCATLTPWGGGGTPLDGAWAEYIEERITTGSGITKTCTVNSSWAREKITLPCGTPSPGVEWIVISDGCPSGGTIWARPARLYGCVFTNPDFEDTTQIATFTCKIVGDAVDNISIDNGLPLDKVLELFLNTVCIGYTVVSNFFQVNPDITSVINYVTGQRSKTRFITVFQKSDVKRPSVSGNATIANMTLESLLTDLINMFNVRWRVEANVLRIEHVSYFTKNPGFNLLDSRWAKWTTGIRKYTYDTSTIPKREVFTFMEAGPGDFVGTPILYADCVTKDGRNTDKNYAVDNVTTDVELCLANPDPDNNVVQDDGFVFIAADFDDTDSTYFIISEATILGGNVVNNSLAWAQLQRDYWKYDRPARKGQMNYQDTAFITIQPTKRGTPITIPLCCDDNFDPDTTITTALGVGIVDKATFSFKNETVTLELLYAADVGLVDNQPPHAENDVVHTPEDTPVLIDVIANDTDEKNLLLVVKVILPPLHGTATVIGKKVRYKPNLGYLGSDLFLYTVSDEWNQPSNNAMVSIIVDPPVIFQANDDGIFPITKNTLFTASGPLTNLFLNDTPTGGFTLDSFDATSINGGTVVVNSDGTWTFNPLSGYVGDDSFTYTITDGSTTSTATVNLNVIDPDAPVANPDFYQTVKNVNLVIAAPGVLANDTTTIGSLTVQTPGTFATTAGGSVTIASDGSFVYTPLANYVGADSFTYFAYNGTSGTPTTVNIQVLPLVYVRLSFINQQSFPVTLSGCSNGATDGGLYKTQTIRFSFYSNSAGTVPFDVTGLSLLVYMRRGIQSTPGGVVAYTTDNYATSGTQTDPFTNEVFFRNMKNCVGATVLYINEVYNLEPGAYTII